MVVVLHERERLRDLFGRQVGHDVAHVTAAAEEVRLGGELRRVAVLFVDLVGPRALAARLPPVEVVALLNRFFSIVVDVVDEHGGWINEFEGTRRSRSSAHRPSIPTRQAARWPRDG